MEQINCNEYDNIVNWVPDAIIDLKYYSSEFLIEPIKSRLQELQCAMLSAGFEVYSDEWWHFIDSNWLSYEADCKEFFAKKINMC